MPTLRDFPSFATTATEGPGGVYSFSGLPGQRGIENSAGDDDFWASHPPVTPYTVQVTDPALRYLPFQFSATLPVRDLFARWDSPLSSGLTPDPSWLPIFSSPSRIVPGPVGTIRATLQDSVTGAPAAWALLTAQASGLPPTTALADERGVVSLFQPYPEPASSGITSPLSAPNLTNQSWPITISVYYSGLETTQGLPDLDDVLRQSAAFVWRDSAHTSVIHQFQLSFGNELILRSLDSGSGRGLSVLLVTSATSPL